MIAHHVLFWLSAKTNDEQKANFLKGLQSLEEIEVVQTIHIGTPAPIERAVVDATYTFSLLVFFKDLAAHDIYQTHAIHQAFLAEFKAHFEKVVIYDAQ